jgi:UDP-N-acetylglucosamine transferase subunit ALG13
VEGGHKVILASSGRSAQLLTKEFPELTIIEIPSYNIYYQKKGSFILKVLAQLGKVFRGIRTEHRHTQKIVEHYGVDLIIADNRYGVWHENIYSVIITHQMMIKIPGFRIIEPIVYAWLQWQHRKFDAVWIPDTKEKPNVSGDLSHKYRLPRNAFFIGILTRFRQPEAAVVTTNDVLAIVSGPEPQRSIFESLIIEQAKKIPLQFIIVQGISETNNDQKIADNIRLISHLPGEALFQLTQSSSIIISRGGYSTLMDLALLNKQCIFVPTPGQTEQEYLVDALSAENMVYGVRQDKFNLEAALASVKTTKGFLIQSDAEEFKNTLTSTIAMATV